MKRNYGFIILLLVGILMFGITGTGLAYDHQNMESYLSYRIKYIHDIAYNTNANLSKKRAKEYADSILYWSDYYSRELEVDIDPLVLTAIIEAETNFVSKDSYDNGASIGVSSMRVTTAKWIADRLGVEYKKWRMLDATDLGIRFTAYYLGLAYQNYNNDVHKVIVSYNQGFHKTAKKDVDQFYNNYLFKVLGRYNYYQKRLKYYGPNGDEFFKYKLAQLN
ncbi:transglycosylase SLT domain-containing protein [Halanaerobacter jeridensis]|uniref:Soluble lytic murein transglycosylase n=1 Tax=Halanaerobacter jeridensis TaxID=706427 RepID=A0A939BP33_9FIRM|nr:transglycosylase SLT domain-containing protein [Halanaerobacter jeridensis]MBM7556462.1 soluble lytic murein transglycosylase [Halanaerobacter jeridensis]